MTTEKNNGKINLKRLGFHKTRKIGRILKIFKEWKKGKRFPELTFDNKKATTNEEKAILFKQFKESIFIVDLEHKISDQIKMLIEMNVLNDNDLETIDMN